MSEKTREAEKAPSRVNFHLGSGDEDDTCQLLHRRLSFHKAEPRASVSGRKSCMGSGESVTLAATSVSVPVLVPTNLTAARDWVERMLFCRTDDDCLKCKQASVCTEHGSYSLLRYEQTPEFMKGNLYVTSGYRPEGLNAFMAFRSMFHLNNETVNIWSHIVGFFIFAYYLVHDNLYTLPAKNAGWMDHIIISLGLICFMICMAMSACFHIFWCISESTHNTWLCLDLLGVTFGILGCYVTGIHYAFYCYNLWHNTYMSIFLFLTLITILAPFHPEYAHAKFYWARLSLYMLVGIYGVIPTIHWVAQHGGLQSEFTQQFLPSVLIVYGLCALGVAFYILMIPERWLPGWFDLIGWSHQWWHVLILLALIWWRTAGLEILDYRRTTACDGLNASFLKA